MILVHSKAAANRFDLVLQSTKFISKNNHNSASKPEVLKLTSFKKISDNHFLVKENVIDTNKPHHFHIISKDLYYLEIEMPEYTIREYFKKERDLTIKSTE